jgi:acyl-CoA thioesterase
MKFTEVMRSITAPGEGLAVTIPPNWLQGRTTYGGFSAALCLEAVTRNYPDLPPLRSAQISFAGPVGGAVRIATEILRRGKSVSVIGADILNDEGVATRAVFAFGASRTSKIGANFAPRKPDFPHPDQLRIPRRRAGLPGFVYEFDARFVGGGKPFSSSQDCDVFVWVRHVDEAANSAAALLALADMPPPGVFPMFPAPAPISTMTWALNFLEDPAKVGGGWFLLESKAEHAADGYSSQDMFAWRPDGRCILAGRQSVAVFV